MMIVSGSSCAAVAVSIASYNSERAPRICPASSTIVSAGDNPNAVAVSADSAL